MIFKIGPRNNNGLYGQTAPRRMAMNGSQPCLMVMATDPHDGHHAYPHYYHHHLHPTVDIPGYDGDYIQVSILFLYLIFIFLWRFY
jgi:hypothetical protein